MDADIGGMIRLQPSLRLGGWMKVFRKCLMEEVSATLEVLEMTDDTEDARQFRVSVFAGVGPRRKFVQSILSFLLNGYWQLHDRVQIVKHHVSLSEHASFVGGERAVSESRVSQLARLQQISLDKERRICRVA